MYIPLRTTQMIMPITGKPRAIERTWVRVRAIERTWDGNICRVNIWGWARGEERAGVGWR